MKITKPRICRDCGLSNLDVKFVKRKRVRNCGVFYQYINRCIICQRIDYRLWYERNRKKAIERASKWKKANRDKVNAADRRAYKRRKISSWGEIYESPNNWGNR